MTSYLSSLLTTTTSRVASIRQNLLPTEDDGATEDDTHLCRVLRAYYTEKGRQFPGWLPPDPKAPPPVVVQPIYNTPGVGARYGGAGMQSPSGGAQPTGLSSLWDKGAQNQGGPAAPAPGGSLRAARHMQNSPFNAPGQRQEVQARPLPSQREGSYQSASPFAGRDAPAAGSASNRLKDRFRSGARSASPASGLAGGRNNSYDTAPSGGGYDSKYEDSFMPREAPSKPFVGSNSPWSSSDAGSAAPRVGLPLPGGPRAGRGPGLPSGPRSMR